MTKVKLLRNVGQSQGNYFCLVTRNKLVKCESPTSYGSKVMTMVKVVEMQMKGHGQGDKVKNLGTDGKVMSRGIHM